MTTNDENSLPATPPVHDEPAKRVSKKTYYDGTTASKLEITEEELQALNANREVRQLVFPYGYDDRKIDGLNIVYQEAVEANKQQLRELGDKVEAYSAFEKLFTLAKLDFSDIKKITKLTFRNNPERLTRLGLDKKYNKVIDAIFKVMDEFYSIAISDKEIVEALSRFGFDENKIAEYNKSFILARNAYATYIAENQESMEATKIKEEKMAILDDWMMDYLTVAKIARARK